MNKARLVDLNLSEKFECEGRLDKEIPAAPCEELWKKFVDIDKKAMVENRRISVIQVHYYGEGNFENPVPQFSEKFPMYDDQNKTIGIVGHDRMIDSPALSFYMNRFNRKTIQFDASNDLFTLGELEIIFWAQQRLSAKKLRKG